MKHQDGEKIILFQCSHRLRGGETTDENGGVKEELIDKKLFVWLNGGEATKINVPSGKESVPDLTLVSRDIAGNWEIYQDIYQLLTTMLLFVE